MEDKSYRRGMNIFPCERDASRKDVKSLRHARKLRNRRRASKETTKTRLTTVKKSALNVEVCYGGDSSGYGSSVSVSGDELGERTKSGVPRLPPIASSPPASPALTKTPDVRTRTASPFTPLTPLTPRSPVKLSPAPSGRYHNRRSLLSLSTATSSTDSAFDSSATSSRTSVKGHILDRSAAASRRSAHLEPPQASWNRKCLSPISTGRPTLKKNLYITDTRNNLSGREMYIQFSIPRTQQPLPLPPPVPSQTFPSKSGHLASMGAPMPPHTLPPLQTKIDVRQAHANSWPHSPSGGSNLVLIGGTPSCVGRSLETTRKAPLPAIGTPDLSSSNLHVCRSNEGSGAAVVVTPVSVTVDPSEPTPPRDFRAPALSQIGSSSRTRQKSITTSSLSLCSSGSSTPTTSSLLDVARCADGTIPSINLIAPTPLPPGAQSRPPSRTYSRVA